MGLEIRTLIMMAAVLTLVMGLCLRYVLREYPADLSPGIRLWTLGLLVEAIGWTLFGSREALPDWLAIVGANALLSLAFAKRIQALHAFGGLRTNWAVIYAPVVAIMLDEIVFTYALPSMRGRLLTATPLFCAQVAYGGFLLIGMQAPRRRSHMLTAATFFALAAVLALRVVYEAGHETFATAYSTSPMQTLVFASSTFFPLLATLGFVLMCNDSLNRELERQAMVDPLTGVSNRRTLNARVAEAIALAQRHDRPLALLLVDADHFKHVNDTHGHQAGDDALKVLAATLQAQLRGEDLFGRLGGEEFVIVLPESVEAAANATAERLRRAVEAVAFMPRGQAWPLRVSIGFAMRRPTDDFTTLLRRADLAMYAAKHAGRNCVRGPADIVEWPD